MDDLFAAKPPPAPRPPDEATLHLRLYRHLRTKQCVEHREYINDRWRHFQELDLADKNFVDRFPVQCAARIWEIQLATTFDGWGWKLVRSKRRGEGPDFGIRCDDGSTFWIEATVPMPGVERVRRPIPEESKIATKARRPTFKANGDQVRSPGKHGAYGAETDRTLMLRLLGAINEKRKQYARALKRGLVEPTDGYAVAISGAMLPEAMHEQEDAWPRIVRALFGIGRREYTIAMDGDRTPQTRFAPQPSVAKASGMQIPATLFASGEASDLGGVIFCGTYVKERPERRGFAPGSDLIFVINPFAARPFPGEAPRTGRVFFLGVQVADRRVGASAPG